MTTRSALISRASELIASTLGHDGRALNWIPSSLTKRGVYSYARMSEVEQQTFCDFMARYSLSRLRVGDTEDGGSIDILPWYQKLEFPPQIGAELFSRKRGKAKVLKPLVHDTLLREFGAEPKQHPQEPGMWVFDFETSDGISPIEMRYRNMGVGLEMRFVTYNVARPLFFADQLCCFGGHSWNMIFEGNELQEVSKIPRYFREAHELCRRLRLLDSPNDSSSRA